MVIKNSEQAKFARFFRSEWMGRNFIFFTSERGDGLLHSSNSINRLFYTREFEKAEELIHALSSLRGETLRSKLAGDSKLSKLFEEMAGSGFLSNSNENQPISIVWNFDDCNGSILEQQHLHSLSWSGFGNYRSPTIKAHVRRAEAIPNIWHDLNNVTIDSLRKLNENGGIGELEPLIWIMSPLLGDSSAINKIISFLERIQSNLIYEASFDGKADNGNVILKVLEDEGFLPTYSATIKEQHLCNRQLRDSVVKLIELWLTEQPNREVELRFQCPDAFSSPELVHRYYDQLEELIDCILDLDADLSRLSLVRRALLCLLKSPGTDQIIDATLVDRRCCFRSYYEGDLIADVYPSRECVGDFWYRMRDCFRGENRDEDCQDIYTALSPISFSNAFKRPTTLILQQDDPIELRRRRIWKKLFDWLIGELLQIGRENADFGTPLRLDITTDRKAIYTPLYKGI